MTTTTMTITEGLAEIKTIHARIEKKRSAINPYLARDAKLLDPHAAAGGSSAFVIQERQAIYDLQQRLISIRVAIQKKNLETYLAVEGFTKTVAEWLVWRKEIANEARLTLQGMFNLITNMRTKATGQGYQIRRPDQPDQGVDVLQIVVNIDEKLLTQEIEQMEKILGALDGKLSLINATTTITV